MIVLDQGIQLDGVTAAFGNKGEHAVLERNELGFNGDSGFVGELHRETFFDDGTNWFAFGRILLLFLTEVA